MKNNMNDKPKAISNLQRYYENYLGCLKKSGEKFLAAEILNSIVEDEIEQEDVLFSIVYEKGDNLIWMQGEDSEFAIPRKDDEAEDAIKNFFDAKDSEKQGKDCCKYFRCVGVWVDEENVTKGKIYYVFRIYGWDSKQAIYLNAFEEAYYEWIRKEILRVANPLIEYKEYGKEYEYIKKRLIKRAEDIFEAKMLNLYGVDLGIITEISGNYYEGGECNSALTLKIGNSKVEGVLFSKGDYVEIKKENARKLRKLLEMCQDKQSLFAERETDLKWMVKGICYDSMDENDIVIKISKHMFWEMRIGDEFSVCYKDGKYIAVDSSKKQEKFHKNYKKVFGEDPAEYLMDVFEEAKEQSHGTSIIILGDDSNGDDVQIEVNRLLEESSGIAIEDEIKIPKEFIIGVTSIDGAVIMDTAGKCYAIGVILDGNAAIKGDRAHGARHNSVMKYIRTKEDEELKGIGIIFSEDKTIKFVTTEDDFRRNEDECK